MQDHATKNLDPAPVQDEYAPVIFSQETVSHIVSIDMMSGKVGLCSLSVLANLTHQFFWPSNFYSVGALTEN